uniref:Uncharacterized protein n=1 Tax=Arundo donax TaxID=35708 RepID=A0A0A9CAI8_ARUDO
MAPRRRTSPVVFSKKKHPKLGPRKVTKASTPYMGSRPL